mmetsp:Transcript_8359/g.9586  ORF Transcript_8359/g.9586 Transcript_8359/m.9586 type:complete len:571 (+) Transcript_8359:210-1922(+)
MISKPTGLSPEEIQTQIDDLQKKLFALEDRQSSTNSKAKRRTKRRSTSKSHYTRNLKGRGKKKNGSCFNLFSWLFYSFILVLLCGGLVINILDRFNTPMPAAFAAFKSEMMNDVIEAANATVYTTEKWVMLSMRIGSKAAVLLTPTIRGVSQWFTDLRFITKIYIGVTGCILLLLWLLQREIRRRKYFQRAYYRITGTRDKFVQNYNYTVDTIRRDSKFLAALFPHLIFAGASVSILVLSPGLLEEVSQGIESKAIVYLLPMLLSFRALLKHNLGEEQLLEEKRLRKADLPQKTSYSVLASMVGFNGDNSTQDPIVVLKNYENLKPILYWVRYWTVLASLSVVEPVLGVISPFNPESRIWTLWPQIRLLFMIWLQTPGTSGANVAFSWVTPMVSKYFKRVSDADISNNQSSLFAQMFTSLLGPQTGAKFREILSTSGGAIVAAVPFLFIPFTTSLGCVLFGLLRPIHAGIESVLAAESIATTARSALVLGEKSQQLPAFVNLAASTLMCIHWLEYWLIYPWLMEFMDSIPLLPFTIQLLVILALQIPYFHVGVREQLFRFIKNSDLVSYI